MLIRSGMTRCSICPSVSSVSRDLPPPTFQQPASPFRHFHAFPQYEGMVVGYDDLGPVEVAQHVAGHQLSADVVAVRIVGLQYAQPVPDRNPWRHNQEAACEAPAVWDAEQR